MLTSGTDLNLFYTGMTEAISIVGEVIHAIAEQPVLAVFVGVSILSLAVGIIKRLRSAL